MKGQQALVVGLEKALDGVCIKTRFSKGLNITQFMRLYKGEMSFYGILDSMKVTCTNHIIPNM